MNVTSIMRSRIFVPCFIKCTLVLLLSTKAIQNSSGILIVKDDPPKDNSTNFLPQNVKANFTTITDNSIEVPSQEPETTTPYTNHKSTNASTITLYSELNGLLNSSQVVPTKKSMLSTVHFSGNHSTKNFTTVAPTGHHKKKSSHKYYKVMLYVLIPLSVVLLAIGACFMVRHIQKVKRKRRLERELIHQYSYPNSEAGDDDQERLFEVECIINSQFHSANDQEEKNFDAEIPQVSVATVGEGSKLVIEEESPLINDAEASTSFNC